MLTAGYTSEHGPVKVSAGPDVPKGLLSLMKSYADMLLVLRTTELPDDKFHHLKLFLSDFCNDKSIRQCSTMDDVIDILIEHLKIYYFNIDTLKVSCDRFCSSEVKTSLEQYKEQLSHFLSTTPVTEFKGALETKIIDHNKVETITIKLDESRTEDTLEALKRLVYHFFGIHHKVLILCGTDKGCVRVTYIVPVSLVPILREKAGQLSREYLASQGVLELVIGLRFALYEGLCKSTHHVHSTVLFSLFFICIGIDVHSKADIPKQLTMGVDSSNTMIAAIQRHPQSDIEELQREVEMLKEKCKY